MTPQQAVKKANDSMKEMLNHPQLKMVGKPDASLFYATAKDEDAEDRICWIVSYLFEGGFAPKVELRLFDATTGEPIDQDTIPE